MMTSVEYTHLQTCLLYITSTVTGLPLCESVEQWAKIPVAFTQRLLQMHSFSILRQISSCESMIIMMHSGIRFIEARIFTVLFHECTPQLTQQCREVSILDA